MGFKAQTLETTKVDDLGQILGLFFRENELPLGGNTLGLVLGEISRVHSLKRENT